MATTYSQAIDAKNNISNTIIGVRNNLVQAKTLIDQGQAVLAGMPAAYSARITDINAAADAAPSNVGLQTLKADMAALTAEFQALNTKATSMKNAVAAIDPSV
jgi:hypothetical protein